MTRSHSATGLFCVFLSLAAVAASADTLSGRVLDRQGRGVASARVTVTAGQQTIAFADTNFDGRYGPLDLPPGRYDVRASLAGMRSAPQSIVAGPGALAIEVNFELDDAVSEYVVVAGADRGELRLRITDRGVLFDRSEIQSLQANTLADVLRFTPGLQVMTAGSRGARASLYFRGGDPRDVLVIVDGVAQNPFGGGADAAELGTLAIERLDVFAGSTSVVDGSRAPSGIIRVTTRAGGEPRAIGSIEVGSQASGRAAIGGSGGSGKWTWTGTAEGLRTRGHNGTKLSSGDTVTNDDYSHAEGSAAARWRGGPDHSLRFDLRGALTDRGYTGPWSATSATAYPPIDTLSRGRQYSVQSAVSGVAISGAQQHHAFLTASWGRGRFENPSYLDRTDTFRTTGHYHAETSIGRALDFSSGVDAEYERVDDSLIRTDAGASAPVARLFAGWFVEARQSIADRLFWTEGLRYDYFRRYPVAGNQSASAFRPDLSADADAAANPQAAFTWLLRADGSTRFHADAGRAMKGPSAQDLGLTERPDLRPEHSVTASVGLTQAFASQRLIVDADVFTTRFHDLILPIEVQRAGVRRLVTDNVGESRVRGGTLTATLRLAPALIARATATHLLTRVLDAPVDAPLALSVRTGDPLVRRPQWSFAGSVSVTRTIGSVFLAVNGRGAMPDVDAVDAITAVTNPGYVAASVGGEIALGARARLFARGVNVLNRRYDEIAGYPAQARAFIVGLRFESGPR